MDSHVPLERLSPVSLLQRCKNVATDRRKLLHDSQCHEQRVSALSAENVVLSSRLANSTLSAGEEELIGNVRKARELFSKEDLPPCTIESLTRALADGTLSITSVEAHHLADLAQNVIRDPRGWRFSPVTKAFCAYLLLLSTSGYRGLRGGEGANLGRFVAKPFSLFNFIVPDKSTLFNDMRKTDPDSNFRKGTSILMVQWFMKTVCLEAQERLKQGPAGEGALDEWIRAQKEKQLQPSVRLAWDETNITPFLEFVNGIIYNHVWHPGATGYPNATQDLYTQWIGSLLKAGPNHLNVFDNPELVLKLSEAECKQVVDQVNLVIEGLRERQHEVTALMTQKNGEVRKRAESLVAAGRAAPVVNASAVRAQYTGAVIVGSLVMCTAAQAQLSLETVTAIGGSTATVSGKVHSKSGHRIEVEWSGVVE